MYRRLRDLREDADLLQKDVARYLNCTQVCYSQYELGKRDLPTDVLIRLAVFYRTSTDYLLGLTDLPNDYEPARNSILLNKDFPPAAKAMLQCLVRIISVAYHTNPKAVANELEKLSRVLSSISEETEGGDEGDPGADGF